jgi:signal peptidase II
LYALDQATKLWTAGLDLGRPGWPVLTQHVPLGGHIPVWGETFEWVHFSNTGAAFGIMHDSNRFFIGLSFAAFTGLAWALRHNLFPGRLNFLAILLLLSGILGNLTDRLLHGYVVDFLLFDFGFWPFAPWPAFNVADSCICVAVALLMLATIREGRSGAPNPAGAPGKTSPEP